MPRVNLSDGVAAPVMPRRPAPAPKPPVLRYDSPRVSTTSGATGVATPYAGSNPTPITAPSYLNYYNPPAAPAPAPSTGMYNPGVTDWGSVGGGGGTSAAVSAPVEPPPPPPPPVGGRVWYSKLSDAQKKAEDEKYLRGDSDYTEQIAAYTKALDDYTKRIGTRKEQFGLDADVATKSTNKNKEYSLNSLGEDFGARGLSYSGMFDTEMNRAGERFSEALKGILTARDRNISDATNELADYSSENQIGRGNARRSALLRMAQNQNLIDTSAYL